MMIGDRSAADHASEEWFNDFEWDDFCGKWSSQRVLYRDKVPLTRHAPPVDDMWLRSASRRLSTWADRVK
jgi:hypothetical protein